MDSVSNFCIELSGWLFRLFGLASLATLLAQIVWYLSSGSWQPVSVGTFFDIRFPSAEPRTPGLEGYLTDIPLAAAFAVLSVRMLPVMLIVAEILLILRRMKQRWDRW